MRRFNSSGLKKYSNDCEFVNKIIINGYYKLVMPVTDDEKILKNGLRKNILVFYKNGRVGNFLDYEDNNFDFNPQKAEMGYYGKVNQKCYIKFKIKTLGGLKVIEDEIIFIDNDSLILLTKKSPSSSGFISKYIKINSKKVINASNPDW